MHLTVIPHAQPLAEATLSHHLSSPQRTPILIYTATRLTAATEYLIHLNHHTPRSNPATRILCTARLPTAPLAPNLLQNPSFEATADPPFPSSSFSTSQRNPRFWTPFYNGLSRSHCAALPIHTGKQIYPYSGNCFLLLGAHPSDWHLPAERRFHGVHQALPLNSAHAQVSLHYILPPAAAPPHRQSHASLIVSWALADGTLSDGTRLPLPPTPHWTFVCLHVAAPKATPLRVLHVFIHLNPPPDDGLPPPNPVEDTLLAVDAAAVIAVPPTHPPAHCYSVMLNPTRPSSRNATTTVTTALVPHVHLPAQSPVATHALSVAVALTADRVLRLEALSRYFGGGTVTAAVAVRDERDVETFVHAWTNKAWLNQHVSVSFVRDAVHNGSLAINALRNVAVRMTKSEFVLLLDVDMVPSAREFDCWRATVRKGDVRETLVKGMRRAIIAPVLVSDVGVRPVKDKEEMIHGMGRGVVTAYCLASQRGTRIKRWIRAVEGRRTRMLAGDEPYAIVRRDEMRAFDERFVGYGFNKVSWATAMTAWGWEFYVADRVMVTHLNHVENGWVAEIDENGYLQTWRRFLAYVAELGDFGRREVGTVGEI